MDKSKWKSARASVRSASDAVVAALDWLVQVAERLLVLSLAYVVLRFGYQLLSGRSSAKENELIASVATNYKAVILLLIPLFYRTVRIFLEQVESAFGLKRPPRRGSEESQEEEAKDN